MRQFPPTHANPVRVPAVSEPGWRLALVAAFVVVAALAGLSL